MAGLADRVAVVTGGSRGIGREVAFELARRGCQVVINYHSGGEAARCVVDEIRALGGQATAVKANVTVKAEAEALIQAAVDQCGKLDILVNNAGIARHGLIMMMKEADWDAVLDTNLKGAWLCAKAAVKPMLRARYGRIINVGSVSGMMGQPGNINYSASKAGMLGLTKALAREVGSRQITVNLVAPGMMNIGMSDQIPPDMVEEISQRIPLGYWGSGEDVACAVAFLASDEARYITGHALVVDGGLSTG